MGGVSTTARSLTLPHCSTTGVGVALVVESARHIQVEGVRYVPVTAPGASLSIALAWREEQRSAVVGAVVAVARRTFPGG